MAKTKNGTFSKLLIGLIAVLIVGGGVFFYMRSNKTAEAPKEETKKKTKITEPVNVIDVAERPFIAVAPTADGKNVVIMIDAVKKEATEVDYELEYQAGSLLQGAFGLIDISSLPSETKILLGSCSAGGSCTYHEDVQGGSLTTRFSGKESYALKTEWKYIELDGDTEVSSRDAKFQLESDALADASIVVIANSSGAPEGLKGTLVSEPYSLQTVPELTGTATLSIRANEEGQLMIIGWDGTKWHEFETTMDGKTATAEVEIMQAYVVVK